MDPESLLRLPAEWEPQAGVQLTWPHANSDWAPILDSVEPCFATLAREIAQRALVVIACVDRDHTRRVLDRAGVQLSNVRLYEAPSNDSWARDHGPITVYAGAQARLCDFTFNGWGGKYPAAFDNALSRTLHAQGAYGNVEMRTIDWVLEGGSIDSDGAGTILTTACCLLAPNRNRRRTRHEIEELLRAELGAQRVLWLEHGYIAGDDTDGHVDTLARFCNETTIAYLASRDERDEHFDVLRLMESELQALRTVRGERYTLVPLPMPAACYDAEGARLPITYANFLILNGAVLAPLYGVPEDKEALSALEACFPKREVIGVDCRSLIVQHGSLHCVTMQFPEGISL